MKRYFCDLHIHSCLSPCGDGDMTPANIAQMAALNGLEIVALTDHNTSKNCPAFFRACKRVGLIPVAGMELSTAEDVHAVCLFPTLDGAMDFDAYVEAHRPYIENRPEIFGNQTVMDDEDGILSEVPGLLINASDIPLTDAVREVFSRGGVCYPAHIDRPSGGILEILGDFPCDLGATAFELRDGGTEDALRAKHPALSGLVRTVSSDAHYLHQIAEADFAIALDDEPYSSDKVRRELIKTLRGEV